MRIAVPPRHILIRHVRAARDAAAVLITVRCQLGGRDGAAAVVHLSRVEAHFWFCCVTFFSGGKEWWWMKGKMSFCEKEKRKSGLLRTLYEELLVCSVLSSHRRLAFAITRISIREFPIKLVPYLPCSSGPRVMRDMFPVFGTHTAALPRAKHSGLFGTKCIEKIGSACYPQHRAFFVHLSPWITVMGL
ncbi:hypothetical protein BDR22DRAFT_89332 [Usnea florida]